MVHEGIPILFRFLIISFAVVATGLAGSGGIKSCTYGQELYQSSHQVYFFLIIGILVIPAYTIRLLIFDVRKLRLPRPRVFVIFDSIWFLLTFASAVAVSAAPVGSSICSGIDNDLVILFQEVCNFKCSNLVTAIIAMFLTSISILMDLLFITSVISIHNSDIPAEDFSFNEKYFYKYNPVVPRFWYPRYSVVVLPQSLKSPHQRSSSTRYKMTEPMREEYPSLDQRGGNSSLTSGYGSRDEFRRRSESREQYDMRFRTSRNRSRSRSPRRGRDQVESSLRYDENPRDSRGLEPLISYKVWMMQQTDELTPEGYQQRYEEYKKKHIQRVLRAFFDLHKREEWLQERYSPALRARVEKIKTTHQMNEAKHFKERILSGVATICFDEMTANEGMTKATDFVNDVEDSARILYIRRVPCACPIGTLSEAIKKAGGPYLHLYLSDPVKKSAFDFDRSAYILYDSPTTASEAMPKLHNTFVEDNTQFPPFRLQVSPHRARAPLKTPSYLSVPTRIEVDLTQALRLAQALDTRLFELNQEKCDQVGIHALLSLEQVLVKYPSAKEQLDLVIAYLRRVHHYIYYAGVQCRDMGDILHAHPALFCRPPPSLRDLEEEKTRHEENERLNDENGSQEPRQTIRGWAAALDEKVSMYLKELEPEELQAKRVKERALVDEIETREEIALESTYANYGEKASEDGKHRCRLCTKLFKALDFVKKHIRNKHPELVVDKIAEVGESYMWEQYRQDEQRPMPPLETSSSVSSGAVLGGRGGNFGRNYNNSRHRFERENGGRGFMRDEQFRTRGFAIRDDRMRRNSFDRSMRSPPRGSNRSGYGHSPSRYPAPSRLPDTELPIDPRQISTSYRDLDNLIDPKVELTFDALDTLPPPKKKSKVGM
ncbi:putative Zinc finger C2H2-type [Plasmopara halstedii]